MPPVDSLFPASERVIYIKSPLEQVVCQIRFPAILRIEASPPADFQEIIRHLFPSYQRIATMQPQNFPPELASLLSAAGGHTNYLFADESGMTTLSLTQESLSLTTLKYDRWESFLPYFVKALHALNQIYQPSFIGRIGLRYSNRIKRSMLGLDGMRWSQLLRSEITGELSEASWESNLQDARRLIRVATPAGDGSMLLQHGVARPSSDAPFEYLIDFDFYTENRAGVDDVEAIMDRFHRRAGRAFRWCILDPLHLAMEPQLIINDER